MAAANRKGDNATVSTRANFTDYESVFKGGSGYMADLVDLKDKNDRDMTDFSKICKAVCRKVNTIIKKIQKDDTLKVMGEELKGFKIGKTHVRKRAGVKFYANNVHTWKLDNGLNQRWAKEYKPDGYRAVVAVACITKANIPPEIKSINPTLGHQQQMALALEQHLIAKLLYKKHLPIKNDSFHPGNLANNPMAGIVYLALELGPCSNASSSQSEQHELTTSKSVKVQKKVTDFFPSSSFSPQS